MQQCFTLSDPAMEDAPHEVPLFREFAQLSWDQRLPDESSILRFRQRLEKHKLAEQILAITNDMLIGRGLMRKADTVVDVTLIAAPSSTKNSCGELDPEMHQAMSDVFADAGCQAAHKRPDAKEKVTWYLATNLAKL